MERAMSLLERIIIAHRCRSTHHFIAMDALPHLTGQDAEKWRNLILVHNEELLKGAKAPDAVFKDFKNHVLHVGEGEWGGARDAAMAWYAEAVGHLQEKKWAKAVYALGVLSHYYADPIQPFHTGQTEEEGAMHRAVEWSIAKSRSVIKERIEEIGYPRVEAGEGAGFVSEMVRAGADKSHVHYQTLIDHYNLDAGAKNPPAGLDQVLIDIIAELVAYATSGLALLFSRAFAEAGVAAPNVHITVPGYLATLDIPVHWIAKKLDHAADKRTVTAMYKEYKKTGKVIRTLPDDDKEIRKLHARQVMRRPLKALDAQPLKPLGQNHEPRPQYADFARQIAESLRPEPEELAKDAIDDKPLKLKGKPEPRETVDDTDGTIEATSRKRKKDKAEIKPQRRIVATVAQVATDVVEPIGMDQESASEEKARLKTEEAARAEKERLASREAERAAIAKAAEEDAKAKQVAAEKAAKDLSLKEAEATKRVEQARRDAEKLERIEAEDAAELKRLEAEEAKEFARLEAEEAEKIARLQAEEKTKREAQDALRRASEDRERKAQEKKARLEAEEMARIQAEKEELAQLEAEENEAYADEDDAEDEFTLEELAAFETNLTERAAPREVTHAAPPVESFFENGSRPRTRLTLQDQVVDAPSIGKKTARRLNRVGIFTVEDLIKCDSEEIAFELDVTHIDEPTLEDWKAQARLMMDVPGLRVHDAQILVGAGVRSAEDLAAASATRIFHASMGFLKSSEGSRIVRDDHVLDQKEVDEWIGLAQQRYAA